MSNQGDKDGTIQHGNPKTLDAGYFEFKYYPPVQSLKKKKKSILSEQNPLFL